MTEKTKPEKHIEHHLLDLFNQHHYETVESEVFALVEKYPDWETGWKLLTDIYLSQGKDARLPALRLLNSAPTDPESIYKYGLSLKNKGDLMGAIAAFSEATKLKSDFALAYNKLGIVFSELGNINESIKYFNKALELKPNFHQCFSNLLSSLSYSIEINNESLFEKHLSFAKIFELPLKANWPKHTNQKNKNKLLKIGFVSPDFNDHSISYFFDPVLKHLSLFTDLSLYAYSNSSIEDSYTQNIRAGFRHWNQVDHLSDKALANKIRSDEIDILIDLSGHSDNNRLLTFAMKPAPIQVSWLGNLYSTGLSSVDYYFADEYLAPKGKFNHQFSEKLVQLPACTAFMPSLVAPEVNILPAHKNEFITFACFNRPNKITQLSVELWSKLLHAINGAKLLLAGMPNDGSYDAIIEWFNDAGISKDRLVFHPRSYMKHYLTLHHEVDICLDTVPSNGFTTTCHAAWMGVPTLCLSGDRTISRGAMAIMRHIGLHDFIAINEDDFIQKGKKWSDDLLGLADIRNELRGRFNDSALAQPEMIANAIKAAFQKMWHQWCEDVAPAEFEIKKDDLSNTKGQEIIYVTQPNLPSLKEFVPYLEQIWNNKILTNGGPFHQQLEKALCEYLGVKHIALFANGTLALLTALQSLRITGEVLTTPYSFVATSHSLLWNGIKPVFVDIDPTTLNIDPKKIEAAITPATTAIMPVHCYGYPCDVDAIQTIADNYNLKVIYDAAHAFGVQHQKQSLLKFGDLSVLSFHATKVFNTFEGGAIICPDAKTKLRIDHLKNFGFVDEVTVVAAGINGKMSEMNAAFGLLQLKGIDQALEKRKHVDAHYRQLLQPIRGIDCVISSGEGNANYAYFPILVNNHYTLTRDALYTKLRDAGIYARRYFYPLISDFPMYRNFPSSSHENLPIAADVANRVICLPIYPALSLVDIKRIAALVVEFAPL